jgi:hypothetical protein
VTASIVIVHAERKSQRVVQRILDRTGVRLDVADDLARAERLIAERAPALVVLDGSAVSSPDIAAVLAAAAACGGDACIALLDAGQLAHAPEIVGLGAAGLLVHPMPVLGEELTVTVRKLIRGDLFGAEKYLLWGTDLHRTTVTRAGQRSHIVGDLAAQLRAGGHSARIASMAMLVTDELVSNAVHNAPVDAAGAHYRAELARDADLALDARHQVGLRWGCDGRYLAIEVTDNFGSLARDTVLRSLVRNDVRSSGSGAGMGIALTYRSCDHLVFNLAPGKRTEVIALIDVRYPHGERVPASSYNVFVER